MRHRVKKIKFKLGLDANRMLMRKLCINFLTKGKIKTTLMKAKVLKSVIEKLVSKTREATEANKNYLLSHLGEVKLVKTMFDQFKSVVKDKTGGYVKIIRLGKRNIDGAFVARLEWVTPVVVEKVEKKEKPK